MLSAKIDAADVKKMIKNISSGISNVNGPLKDAGEDLVDFFEDNIKSEGEDLNKRWKPLSISTLQARARGYGHYAQRPIVTNKILQWTGKLKRSFRSKVSGKKLTIDNTADYFKYNLNRPMLGINAKVKAIVLFNLEKYISKLIK